MINNLKKRALSYITLLIAFVFCVCGICGCTNTNEPSDTDLPNETYFLQKIEIEGSNIVRTGGTVELTAIASARNASGKYVTSTEGFTYTSLNTSVATVNDNGVIRGESAGNCDITVKHTEFQAETTYKIQVVELATAELDFATGSGINTFGRAQLDNGQLLFVNALSGFEVCFEGTELNGTVKSVTEAVGDKNYLLVEVDGKTEIKEITTNNVDSQISLVSNLTSGIHVAKIYKLTDEAHSSIRLISLSDDVVYLTAPQHTEPKITVYGDYISSGYGLGNGLDASKTYAYLAAKELGAEIEIVSSPVAALAIGQNSVKDVWDHYSFNSEAVYGGINDSDYIVINLGENDGKLISERQGTKEDFVNGYKQIISAMRQKNQTAKIICCYGMTTYSNVLSQSIRKAVQLSNDSGDRNVYALEFERCDGKTFDSVKGYPNEQGHEINAEHLKNALLKFESEDNVPSLQNKVNYDTHKEDISVILLAGQSNMEGNSWWKYLEGKDDRYNDYKAGFDGIKMSFANHESDAGKTPSFNSVKLGYGGARNPGNGGDNTTCFGPEIGMAKMLHDNGYDNKVVFIKFAVGATYLHNDANNRNWQAKSGTIYKAFIQYTDACIAELAKTYNVSVDAMCWMQGESDTEQQAHVDAYKSNINNFLTEVRKHYTQYNSDFMFYDAYINWPRDWQGDRPDQINEIKKQLVTDNLHYELIDTLSARLHSYNEPENVDLAHFDSDSEIKLGEMFAEAYMKDFPLI